MMMPPRGRQIASRENAQRLQLAHPFRHVSREKQRANDVGKENENDEVVELQRAAQCGQAQGLVIVTVQGTMVGAASHLMGLGVGMLTHGVVFPVQKVRQRESRGNG